MKYLRRLLMSQRRTLFILMIIVVCFAVDAAWQADWPRIFDMGGSTANQQEDSASKLADDGTGGSADVPPDSDRLPHKDIRPDFVLPAAVSGTVPVLNRIPTTQKVVFLTIDDGLTKTPDAPKLLKQYNIKAPIFLNDVYVQQKPSYFRSLLWQGMTAESHTVDHADLTTLEYDQQVAEICDNSQHLLAWFGRRPDLFRPPYGSYNDSVLQAASACGMRAAIMWSAKANGGSMQYQDGHTGLVPGDIVLMHFRPEFAQDFQAFIAAAKAAGLQPENLEDWLAPPRPIPNQMSI